jgi:hypothetical protein
MEKKIHSAVESINKPVEPTGTAAQRRPDESAAFSVEGHVKIFDPNTEEIYVEKRA